MLSGTPPPRDIGKPRLPVDRVFTLPGSGTVVTGTLFGGTLRRGQSVVIQPSGTPARIRRIQSHGRDVEASGPGTRTALNLADVDAVDGVHRGDVVTLPDLGGPSDSSTCCWKFRRRATRSLKDGVRVRVHHGSGNVAGACGARRRQGIAVGGRELAQLRLEAPAFVFAGDRFTVRDWSEQHTLAGASCSIPTRREERFAQERQTWLERVAESLDDPGAVRGGARRPRQRGPPLARFREVPFQSRGIDAAGGPRCFVKEPSSARRRSLSTPARGESCSAGRRIIDDAHRAHPEYRGWR